MINFVDYTTDSHEGKWKAHRRLKKWGICITYLVLFEKLMILYQRVIFKKDKAWITNWSFCIAIQKFVELSSAFFTAKVKHSIWTTKEKVTIKQHFQTFTRRGRSSGQIDCLNAVKSEIVLSKFTWRHVKFAVKNTIVLNRCVVKSKCSKCRFYSQGFMI